MAMNSHKNQNSAGNMLNKQARDPMAEVRVMQVNSSTSVPLTFVTTSDRATSVSASTQKSEQPVVQINSPTFSSLVEEAKSYPEVRNEVVAAYQSQIASGQYPPVDVISGLADLLTGATD
jgi:hypothetical protein